MDGLLRTLTRSRNAPSPTRDSRGRSRHNDKSHGGNNHGQIEIILEALARGLVEYAVRKYVNKHNGGDGGGKHDDRRISSRAHHDNEDQARGGIPNMDNEMLMHLGRNILSKAMDRFGAGGGEDEDEREGMRASGLGQQQSSRDRRHRSRERSQDYSRGDHGGSKDDEGRRRRHHDRDGHQSHRSGSQYHAGSSSPSRRHRDDDDHGRRRHRSHYGPLVDELEALSNTIISLNERQPGHADCEYYDVFVRRSGKVQESIGRVLTQIREREERREERRGRRRS